MDIDMDDNYYSRLGVGCDADAQQIKRAYYTLVKKYPPERFPEEYKELRTAYGVLSDTKKRADYDKTRAMPEVALRLYERAQTMERTGRRGEAVEAYSQILAVYPELTQVRLALARAYKDTGKPGKAMEIWEKLCDSEPENAEYSYELAQSYSTRGWSKKAVARCWRALELDDGNAVCWRLLIDTFLKMRLLPDARMACDMALQAMEKHGVESVRLLASVVAVNANSGDDAAAERYLEKIIKVMRTGGDPDRDLEGAVELLLSCAEKLNKIQYVPYTREISTMIPNIPDELREILDQGSFLANITALEKEGIPELILELLVLVHEDCDCKDCTISRAANESLILYDIDDLRPQLERLRKDYPDLYATHADFFDLALSRRDIQKQLYYRKKILDRFGAVLTYDEPKDDDNSIDDKNTVETKQPVRVELKVGRNDPCPCGSGKKYKNCCGK